jgi:plasmid stability protein
VPVALTIQHVPDGLAAELHRPAASSYHSLEHEASGMLTAALGPLPKTTVAQFLGEVRAMGIRTPSQAAALIREDRHSAHRD